MDNELIKVILKDKRTLAYAEYGDPGGAPLIYCHGCGTGSRIFARIMHERALHLGIRVISFDRPGIGYSSPQPDRTVLDITDDINELADHLNIGKYGLISESAGSTYALACAYKNAERVLRTILVSAAGPVKELDNTKDMSAKGRMMVTMFRNLPPWATAMMFKSLANNLIKNPDKVFEKLATQVLPIERDIVYNPEYQQAFTDSVLNAVIQGSEQVAIDVQLSFQAWGFSLEQIPGPVEIWHGEQDMTTPPNMAHYMERILPNCNARYFPGEGHVSVMHIHLNEILQCFMVN